MAVSCLMLGFNARLGRVLVFDDEIAAQRRMRTRPDAHPTQFRKWRRSPSQPAISGKRRSERSRTERVWEPIGVRRAKGSGKQRHQESEGGQEGQGPWRIKRMDVPVTSSIRSLILHLHLHSLYFSRTHPPTPSHCRIR